MILKATYKRSGSGWEGVKDDATLAILWTCGHYHKNRDHGREDYGGSAVGCAKREIDRRAMGEDERGFIDGRARRLPINRVEFPG